jgi:hypothetical protein
MVPFPLFSSEHASGAAVLYDHITRALDDYRTRSITRNLEREQAAVRYIYCAHA